MSRDAEETSGREANLVIRSKCGTAEINVENVWSVKDISITSEHIPKQADLHLYSDLSGIQIPNLDAGKVELLIGSDTPEAFWIQEERRGQKGEPYAMRTTLGWAIIGPLGAGSRSGAFLNVTQ